MLSLWTLLAGITRLWAWTCHRSAATWSDRQLAAGKAVVTAAAGRPKDERERIAKDRLVGRMMDRQDRAERRANRKAKLAERLTRWHGWLSRPRTLAGGIAGALTVPGLAVGLTAGGVDVPAMLTAAAGWVKGTVGM